MSSTKIDCHVHIVGDGTSGTGAWVKVPWYRRPQVTMLCKTVGVPAASVQVDLDKQYASRLSEMLAESELTHAVILAHEHVYRDDGTRDEFFSSFYVPNDYVLRLADENRSFIPAVSIHPGRADALEELERCIARGARVMKCLPNCHNIDCGAPRYREFWERMAAAKMILLAHTGGELSVPVANRAYQDPRHLTLPLECGVTTIAAHAATSSHPLDQNYTHVLAGMLGDYPHLFCDNSALCTPLRSAHLRTVLREPFVSRIVHGSDVPIPVSGLWLALRGLISWQEFKKAHETTNSLERDYRLKRALGFPDESFSRLGQLLGL